MDRKTFWDGPVRYTVSVHPDGVVITKENTALDDGFKEVFVPRNIIDEISELVRPREELAEQHAEWFASTLYEIVRVVYREAFQHGWKHAEEGGR